jgi:hypothetical protein
VSREERHALAYVLRLWRVTNGDKSVWRAALQDIRTGERHGFPGLLEAVRHLEQQMERLERDLGRGPSPGGSGVDAERR